MTAVVLWFVHSSLQCAEGSPPPIVQGGMTVAHLKIASASGRNAMIAIGGTAGSGSELDGDFMIGIDDIGNFIIRSRTRTLLTVDREDNMSIHASLSAE